MNLSAVATVIFALSACAKQELTRSQCVIGHGTDFAGATGSQEHITVAENGSPCGIELVGEHCSGGQFGLGGQIKTPPAHVTASLRDAAEATQISYTPAANFVGNDSFVVSLATT
jgi:hypothetical protein